MGRILGRHYLGLTHYFGHYLEQTRYLESTHCAGEREFRAPFPRSTIPTQTLLQISKHCSVSHSFHKHMWLGGSWSKCDRVCSR